MAAAKQKAGAKPAESKPEENGVQRLTVEQAKKGAPEKEREVVLTNLGASVLVRVLTPTEAEEVQAEVQKADGDEGREAALVSLCLVEPQLTPEQVHEFKDRWAIGDWQTLKVAAIDAIGWGGALRAAQTAFRGPDD